MGTNLKLDLKNRCMQITLKKYLNRNKSYTIRSTTESLRKINFECEM